VPIDDGDLLGLNDIRRLLDDLGVDPRKSLGQNFVIDPNTIRKIVRLAGVRSGDTVVEVGPGLGSLTLGLLAAGASIVAVEKDPALAEALRSRLVGERIEIVEADALDRSWIHRVPPGSTLVANLPYNVATTIVIDVLDHVPAIERLLVMVQREVADRMVASVGDSAYGLPSVRIARRGVAQRVALVGPDVFWPRPRVDSALVDIRRHETHVAGSSPHVSSRDVSSLGTAGDRWFDRVVKVGFAQRRKMLRRALTAVWPAALVVEALTLAGIAPESRAEELTVGDWLDLSAALAAISESAEANT